MPKLRTFVIFAVVGPPLGAAIYSIGLIVGHFAKEQAWPSFDESILIILFSAPFSYVFGLVPALLVALAMVVGPSFFTVQAGALYALSTGLLCGIVFALIFLPGSNESGLGDHGYFVLKVLTCLVPTLICWWLARPKRVDASEAGYEAVRK